MKTIDRSHVSLRKRAMITSGRGALLIAVHLRCYFHSINRQIKRTTKLPMIFVIARSGLHYTAEFCRYLSDQCFSTKPVAPARARAADSANDESACKQATADAEGVLGQ